MKDNTTGSYILEELRKKYEVTEESIGADAHMNKGLMHFHVRSFEVKDFGHLCLFDLNGMFGLMKMETVVLQCRTKDVPLVNFDTIIVPGKKTQMAEFYDTKVSAFMQELNDECMKIKEADSDLDYHLRVGNDPESLLRIYFLHDDDQQLIVIGSLPDHLRAVKVQ